MGQQELIPVPDEKGADDVPELLQLHVGSEPSPDDQDDMPLDQSLIRFDWIEDEPAVVNYKGFGITLAQAGDLFRRPGYGNGLVMVLATGQQNELLRVRLEKKRSRFDEGEVHARYRFVVVDQTPLDVDES